MSLAPHPLEIRTVLMCALLGAGHDVPTAQRMMMEAVANAARHREAQAQRAAG